MGSGPGLSSAPGQTLNAFCVQLFKNLLTIPVLGGLVKLLSRVRLFATPRTVAPPGSSVWRIFQARILEWIAISFSRGSSQPRDQTHISCIGRYSLPMSHQGSPLLLLPTYLYASKFGKLSSGHRTGKGQFSFQSQRKAMPKNAQTTTQLHSSQTLAK